ncbi:MAG: hypothetical protein KGQ41_00035 [Alphaproteobacteria bacterium]|nr:hypothetical protein [Alphaproteobacteria bacterium]
MSFVSLPHDFDVRTGACRGYQIAVQQDGELLPIGFMRGDADLPCDLRKLAENFASILNGHEPLYQENGTHEMFFERHSGGLNFRFKKPDEDGVTEVGAMFTLLPGMELEYSDEA